MTSAAASVSVGDVTSPICRLEGVSKHYGGVKALIDVSLEFHGGSVHAVLGENGAGKSTLMKILAGAETQDAGEVFLDGVVVKHGSVRDANRLGVSIVFQELSLFPDLDLLTNLFANSEITRLGVIDRRQMAAKARPVLQELGLTMSLDTPIGELQLHERQLVEIAKALLVDAKLIIFDEPTSSLTASEASVLLDVIRNLRDRGVAVVFVSHRLEEVTEIADTVTVLREGRHIVTSPVGETSIAGLVTDMIGTSPDQLPDARVDRVPFDAPGVVLKNVNVPNRLSDVSLEVRPGEILGIAGLEDAGCREVMDVIYGLLKPSSGEGTLPDENSLPSRPSEAVQRGVALVPSDRRKEGLMLDQSITTNIVAVTAGVTHSYGRILKKSSLRKRAISVATTLGVRYNSVDNNAGSLSGGNQQKVVLGKWLDAKPSVFLLDDPTRGVDLGAKFEIYSIIHDVAESGAAVIFASTELEEYRHLCNRVLVMRRGVVKTELRGDEISAQGLLHAMNV